MKFAIVALLLMTAPALAGVQFDPATGTGSVNRGTINSKLGPAAVTPEGAPDVNFIYVDKATFSIVCTRNGSQRTFVRGTKRIRTVLNSVEHEIKDNPQSKVVGFLLTGFGPELQPRCPTAPVPWTFVSATFVKAQQGILTACFEGSCAIIFTQE